MILRKNLWATIESVKEIRNSALDVALLLKEMKSDSLLLENNGTVLAMISKKNH